MENIYLGTVANDGTGDSLRVAGGKINNNFAKIVARDMEEGIRLSDQSTLYPKCIPLLVKTTAGTAKSDLFVQNQTFDSSIYDCGEGMKACLDWLTSNRLMTGGSVLIGPGFWHVATPSNPGLALIYIGPRQYLTGTSEKTVTAIHRDNSIASHFVMANAGEPNTVSEFMNSGISNLYVDGGGTFTANDPARVWDSIHIEKPTTGSWTDTKFMLEKCTITNGLRHNIYYAGRGDSLIKDCYIGRSGGVSIMFEKAYDNIIDSIIASSSGSNALMFKDGSNLHVTGSHLYFVGSNIGSLWDGASVDAVITNGAAIRLDNAKMFYYRGGRVEDCSGGAIVLDEVSGCIIDTVFNNQGTLGSYAQVAAGTKDYGVNNISATVAGVPLIKHLRGGRPSWGVKIKGPVRQARSTQQLKCLVEIDPANQYYREYRDWDIDLWQFIAGDEPVALRIDNVQDWANCNKTNYWQDTFKLVSRSNPAWFRNVRMRWNGAPMKAFHERTQNVRNEHHNVWDTLKNYALPTSIVANGSSVVWSVVADYQCATITVDTDTSNFLNGKTGVKLSGFSNPLLNNVFNVAAVTSNTIKIVVRPNFAGLTLPANTSGETGTIAGPYGRVTLGDRVTEISEYIIRINSFDSGAQPLEVVLENSVPSSVFLGSVGEYRFKVSPSGVWTQI